MSVPSIVPVVVAVQAICTIVANRVDKKDKVMQERWATSEEEMGHGGASKEARGGTLVVCPTIALKQWQSEIARFVKPGTLKVVIHHGPKRATLAEASTVVVVVVVAFVANRTRKHAAHPHRHQRIRDFHDTALIPLYS